MPFVSPPPLPEFLEAELPFERRAYRLEGASPDAGRVLHLLDHGARDGQVVVLMHGNPTWSFLWRKVMSRLDPARFRCIAPDALGFGLSSKLSRARDHQLDRHLDALVQLIDALELGDDVVLVGQDWGGPFSMGIGARALDGRVKGIVLGNTSVLVPNNPRGTLFHKFANAPVISDVAFRVFGFPQDDLGRVQGDKGSIRGIVRQAYRWPLEGILARSGPLGLARMVPSRPDHPSLPALGEIEAWVKRFEGPMALVWGERDPVLGRALKRHVREFPNATVTRTQAGHFLQEEVPGELAAAIQAVAGVEV